MVSSSDVRNSDAKRTPSPCGWPRIVLHADMDAFYASVEQLDNPTLRGQPVLVGPNSDRGVVLTASYEARPFGVGSAMPVAIARRKCPQAIFVPPRFERYQALSEKIMALFRDFSPSVEAISLDEAFIDMTGSEHLFGPPQAMAQQIQQGIARVTGGLTASVGVASTKYVAKVASGYRKPNAITVVPPQEAVAWLAVQDVSRLWGAGPKTQARLKALGLNTIGDVAAADPGWLKSRLGAAGLHFYDLAHARDPRPVEGVRRSRSISSDRTLGEDITDRREIARHLQRSADRLAPRLRRKGYRAGGVRIKLKTSQFRLITRQCVVSPTDEASEIYRAAQKLLHALDEPGPFRLVGLGVYDLERADAHLQGDLFKDASRRRLELVLNAVQDKFGSDAVHRARDMGRYTLGRRSPNLDFLDAEEDDADD